MIKSYIQVQQQDGLIYFSLYNQKFKYLWTLTVWEDQEKMRVYRNSDSHLKAMKVSRQIASDYDYAYWVDEEIPGWKMMNHN
ncbi:hypothetical protein ACLIA0_07865 [Bacillaceae bacterium W0354]